MNGVIQPARYKKVLIIDDDEIDLFISKRIIESSSFACEVILKESAAEALQYLESMTDHPKCMPEIIFLDLNLPDKSSFEFIEKLSALRSRTRILFRVAIISNVIDSSNTLVKRARSYTMVEAAFEKPLNPVALRSI